MNETMNSVRLGDAAPDFRARSTRGNIQLSAFRGRWLVFFSHPADFTPVCTSEFIAFAKAHPAFLELDCDLLGLSVDSLPSHLAWARSIERQFGTRVQFPIVEDASMAVARAYGMLSQDDLSSAAVRATFVIDPSGIVRATLTYPMNVGRSVSEILRLVEALQTADARRVLTPEGWRPGDAILFEPPMTSDDASVPGEGDADWYYRLERA